jgi:exodeoxyribonuclease-3
VKLVTWNVNSLKMRMPRVLGFVEQHRPEILCLQETKVEDSAFPEEELRAAGYHSAGRWAGVAIARRATTPAHHSAGRWAGVAILSTDEPQDVSVGLPGEVAENEARWIEAAVHGLRVANAYVPNGRSVDSPPFEDKLRFFEAMRERAPHLDAQLGDVNVTRDDRDV